MIRLAGFERTDFGTLIGWIRSKDFMFQWCGSTFTYPLDELQLDKYMTGTVGKNPVRNVYKAVDPENGKHIGNLTLEFKGRKEAVISCVIVGDPAKRGKGIGEKMIEEAVKIGFKKYGVKKISLNVFRSNGSAVRCYEKAGFRVTAKYPHPLRPDDEEWVNLRMVLKHKEWNKGKQ